jgi:hypothetical protein
LGNVIKRACVENITGRLGRGKRRSKKINKGRGKFGMCPGQ